jgi:hypothetical protein
MKYIAYKEVLDAIEKHKEIFSGDYEIDIRERLKTRINIEKIADEFGISINSSRFEGSDTYVKVGYFSCICLYGEKYRRTVSWSDDGSQPEDEWLYIISFPTGPYIFGDDYPTKSFMQLFSELKGFNPKYSDTTNHNLYFTKDTAKFVHESFDALLNKYKAIASDEIKEKRRIKLQEELDKLDNKS